MERGNRPKVLTDTFVRDYFEESATEQIPAKIGKFKSIKSQLNRLFRRNKPIKVGTYKRDFYNLKPRDYTDEDLPQKP